MPPSPHSDTAELGEEIDTIPVPISYDIIRLFSEGLYKSPHKAIEELVSNGYDAGAKRVHVLLPEQPDEDSEPTTPLWVLDDGHGLDVEGFHRLWRIAESDKADSAPTDARPAIGQFGIGKLAAYVLAWRLTHISRVGDRLLLTEMNFRKVTGSQADTGERVSLSLRKVDEDDVQQLLADIKTRDPQAWRFMFETTTSDSTWTAAGLSDFRDLYKRLSTGTLNWVLRTGLPLHTNFRIYLNGAQLQSSKSTLPEIHSVTIDESLAGLGPIRGTARVFERELPGGKSDQHGRSYGFFIRVRGRVINLEDELFGLSALNHAAWSRFALELDAEGLRDHLLSAREGVRDSTDIEALRGRLKAIFNECRSAYDTWKAKENEKLDVSLLFLESPSAEVLDPLLQSVRTAAESDSDSFYVRRPPTLGDTDLVEWLTHYREELSKDKVFSRTTFTRLGPNAPAARFDAATRTLNVNVEHPFIDKITEGDKRRGPARLFASSEILLEGQLENQGVHPQAVADVVRNRDRVLRLTAGQAPPTAGEVLRQLEAAASDHKALERAVGAAFASLGFEYERRGGTEGGPDGILEARLGVHDKGLADYRLVYDTKQTKHPSVPADKIDFTSLETFRQEDDADFGFFIAHKFAGQAKPEAKVNTKCEQWCRLSLLTLDHVRQLVTLHFSYGLTLTRLRTLFEEARTVPDVAAWLQVVSEELQSVEVPLEVLLQGLEDRKGDHKATPNVIAVRAKDGRLEEFEPERLIARLKAVEAIVGSRWLEVESTTGQVRMHHTARRILEQLDNESNRLPTCMTDMTASGDLSQ